MLASEVTVLKKKKGITEPFQPEKIHIAIRKSAERVLQVLTDEDCEKVSNKVLELITTNEVGVRKLHNIVEVALDECGFGRTAESYRQYRNFKNDAQKILEAVDRKTLELSYKMDKSNANCDSAIVPTKRSLIYGEMQKEKYNRIFLTPEELKDTEEGYYYIHDKNARWDTTNCELCNYGRIMKGGFTLANIEYSEPRSVASAIAVLSDLAQTVSGATYGGNSIPEVDTILAPYCEKSYQFYLDQYKEIREGLDIDEEKADQFAVGRVRRELEQGLQSIEHTFNSVSSSRGDFPFTTFTFGHDTNRWAALVSSVILYVRKSGQGRPGHKVPVLFPKLVFIYDSKLHGPGKELEWLFKEAVECTKIAQYPDYLSLEASHDGYINYVGDVYHKWGKIISPMGCRAFLGPSFRDSGTYIPKDDNDEFLIYRCNMGAISMNLPMMWKKSQVEGRDWFEVLDEFMNKIKNIHKRTYNYLCKLKASCNPLVFCEGGFDGGTLNPDESIKPILDKATISFGYGGLHELNMLATGKSTTEDPSFAIATMERINKNVDKFKKQTGILFAIYGTPGESWLPLANEQFVKKYGEVPGIIVKGGYLSNSFHCCVREDITPIEKMNAEAKFWNYSNGGKISHIRINNIENTEGIISLIRYGMSLGLYLGVNHPENHCLDCSCHWAGDDSSDDKDDVCPECGSHNLIKIRRIN